MATVFARQAFRAAQPLRTQCRRYATDKPLNDGSSNNRLYATGAISVAIAGAAYYYGMFSGQTASTSSTATTSTATTTTTQPQHGAGAKSPSSEHDGAYSASGKKAFTGGDQGFISLKLDSVELVNHNSKRMRFALPEDDQVSGLAVASALLTKYKGPEMEKPVLRPYTPVSDENERGFLDLLIKKYPDGPMSNHLHNMEPGQRLDFKGPLPKYAWEENKHSHIALVAGGTGVSPMYQLTRAIFNNANDKTKVTLVFGNVTEEDILLKKEFEHLENTYPQRFRAFYVLDNPPEGWTGAKGYINKELLKTVLPEPKSENVKIFVCGPPGMYKSISGAKKSPSDQGELGGILKELGYTKEQVYKF